MWDSGVKGGEGGVFETAPASAFPVRQRTVADCRVFKAGKDAYDLDLETVFIFAWAVAFFELGWQGFIAVAAFIAILGVALVYELSTGALDWGIKSRTGKSPSGSRHPEEQH